MLKDVLKLNTSHPVALKIELLSTLEEALVLAAIRNECRFLMTNDQSEISPSMQRDWYNNNYTQQRPQNYWVWLLKETDQQEESIIGYFASKEDADGFYITEGLLERRRGRGLGTFMLSFMMSKELFHCKPVFADIFTHNNSSIALHKKLGFAEYVKMNDQVTRFVLKRAAC